jgi:hypothetical protein
VTRLRAALGVALVGGAVLTIPASDNFDRADGALGSNWTPQTTLALQIGFNQAENSSGSIDYACAGWNTATDTFSANQSAQLTISNAASDSAAAIGVRTSGHYNLGTYSGYALNARGSFAGGSALDKVVLNVGTDLIDLSATTWASGDIAKIEVTGTTITGYKNGVSLGSVVDSSLASGQPNFCLYGIAFGERIDNWTADNLGGGTPPASTGKFLLLGVGHHP